MSLLTLQNASLKVGDRQLFDGVSLVVGEGERIGLVGPNGCGKSTLLRMLAGELQPETGDRTVRRELTVGYLAQEPALPDTTAHAAVASGLVGRADVLRELEQLHERLATELPAEQLQRLLRRQEQLEHRLEALGGHDIDHRIDAVLMDLGVRDPAAACASMSGGERRRVALARLLLGAPDLLLLDEPTNHLDAEVTQWLEQHLAGRGGAFVLITHDRYFLDRLVNRVIEIEHGVLIGYDGGYREFLVARAERMAQEARAEQARLNTLRREAAWMLRAPPARTTKAKARIQRFDALVDAAPPLDPKDLEFRIPDGPRLGDRVMVCRGVGLSFGARKVIDGLDLEIGSGQRVGIVGPNGAGKTTLLNLLCGRLAPDRGEVAIGPTVQVAMIDQGRTQLDPRKTVLEEVGGGNDYVYVDGRHQRIESYLDGFLFPGAQKQSLVGTLSGGERNRVLLAKLLCAGGNVLVLDEPTNDLDLMSLRALEEALLAFPGTVLVVSHDRWFLDRVATRIVRLDGSGRARVHEGDLSLLLEKLDAERAVAAAAAAAAERAARARKDSAAAAAPRVRKLSTRERAELDGLPRRIEQAEAELVDVDQALGDAGLYVAARREEFDRLTARRAALPGEIAQLYERWTELEEIAGQS